MVKQAMKKEEEKQRNTAMQSKYKGVRKRKWGKWVSEIRLPHSRERIWLGSHDTPEKAARAFDAAQFCLRGGDADFNFPDNPPFISGGRSLTPQEIQETAARFANAAEDSVLVVVREEEESSSPESEIQPESPCTSESYVATSSETTPDFDMSFFDMLPMDETDVYSTDFGLFPVFEDISDDFFGFSKDRFTEILPIEDNLLDESLYLWDF